MGLTDTGLVHIETLRNLTKLYVTGRISTAGLDSLRKLPKLKSLSLTTELIGEEDLPALRRGWNGHEIMLVSPWLSPKPTAGFTRRGSRPNLPPPLTLDNGGQLCISPNSYNAWGLVDKTGQVVNAGLRLSVAARSEDLHRLTRWPELRKLELYSPSSEPLSLDAVAACRKLESLTLLGGKFDLTELNKLRALDKLTDLELRLRQHDESLLNQLGQLEQLQEVRLMLPWIPPDYAAQLQTMLPGAAVEVKLTGHKRFDPGGPRVKCLWPTDLGKWESPGPIKALNLVDFGRRLRSLSGLQNFDGLVHLYLYKANVTAPEQWKHVGRLRDLTVLKLDRSNITDDALRHVGRLSNLWELGLNDTLVSDRGIAYLSGLNELQDLQIARHQRDYGPWITDDALRTIGGLTELICLDLSGLDITDEGLKHLAPLSRLEVLNLSRTHVTNDGLTHLAALKSLKSLHVEECQIDDDGLEALVEHKSLRVIDARRTQITAKAAQDVSKRGPRVHASR